MKKITLLALFTLTLFTVTFGASSSKNTAEKDLSFLTQSFTSKLFDTIPQVDITIVSLDYSGYITFNTPPSPVYGTYQVIPYNTMYKTWTRGSTNITFDDNSTLPSYVRISTPAMSYWQQITSDGFQISNYFLSEYFPVTIKIGTDLSLLTWDL
jgi:hypothetical protein